nr:HAMP domain-containing sensor histidine kinase [Evansella caseinilytica]
MINILHELLLNILFIILFLVFVPMVLDRYRLAGRQRKLLLTLSGSLALIGCMAFPIFISEGYPFDLSLVPVIVGGLLGSVYVSIALWFGQMLFRFVISGFSGAFFFTLIIATAHLSLLPAVSNKFRSWDKRQRLLHSAIIGLLSAIFVNVTLRVVLQVTIPLPYIGFSILFQSSMILFTMYFIEVIKETAMITNRLIEAEKLELVSNLASSVSHEVRNPLTVVKGFLQMMIHTDLPKEKREKYLKLSISEVNRANAIIGDYLSFAKPHHKAIDKLDIKEVLMQTIQVITPLANMNSVIIEKKLDDYLVTGDQHLFHQCFINITKNCIEAMPHGGSLHMYTERKNNFAVITIADTGTGMTKEQIAMLGKPFYTTKGNEGTGLGMLTVFQILHQLHCSLEITSEINKGTCFAIKIPLA